MTPHDWLHLFARWTHFIAGIAWIGSSFYFIWLDSHLEKPAAGKTDVEGELWMVHSGGFYQVERRIIGPGRMPTTLHWFKWEAMITWLSGIALLILVYYTTGGLYLVDPSVSPIAPRVATLLAIGAMVGAWFVYDALWSWAVGRAERLALLLSVAAIVGVGWAFCHFLSGRAAFVHTGALLGSIMVLNVWLRILPSQQKMIDATAAGRAPDLTLSEHAKRRSVHNSYMTFPVLFMMLSNHFPGTFGGRWNWLALVLLTVIGIAARHLMIGKGTGRWFALAPIAAAFVVLTAITPSTAMVSTHAPIAAGEGPAGFADVQAIVLSRCAACHSATPRITAFGAAPSGVSFDDPANIRRWKERIRVRVVETQTMPLGNMTAMTPEERAVIARWIEHGAPDH